MGNDKTWAKIVDHPDFGQVLIRREQDEERNPVLVVTIRIDENGGETWVNVITHPLPVQADEVFRTAFSGDPDDTLGPYIRDYLEQQGVIEPARCKGELH